MTPARQQPRVPFYGISASRSSFYVTGGAGRVCRHSGTSGDLMKLLLPVSCPQAALLDWVIQRVCGHACVYGQIIKTRRKNRIVRVERKLLMGTKEQMADMLLRSEDSDKLNTAFVERHNLTIRRNCAYLHRRTTAHARCADRLREQLELLRCYYNFIRPHMALKFGRLTKTPAMQAGLVDSPLTFRQLFTSEITGRSLFVLVVMEYSGLSRPVLRLAA